MNADKVDAAPEQFHHLVSLQTGREISDQFVIGRVTPIAKVFLKFMLLRILVNIDNETHQISFTIHRNSFEGTFKHRTCSLGGKVQTASIGIEEI